MDFMLVIFQNNLNKFPNPVPVGQTAQKYLNDNFEVISKGPLYNWFQAKMIVTVY